MSRKQLIAAMAAMTAIASQGATGTWNIDAAGNWSLPSNWLGDVPTASGDTANLTFNIGAARTVTVDTNSRAIGVLNIGDSGAGYFVYTLAASGGANLTFNNGGAGAQLNKADLSTAIDIISSPVILADNLVADVAQPVTISGTITESGSRSITKNGKGILYLQSTANAYSGGTILNAGELQVQNNSAGTGLLTINGGIIVPRGGGRTLTNDAVVNADFTMGDGAVNSTMTLAGNVNLGDVTRTVIVPNNTSDPDAVIAGNISGTGGLTKATAGSVFMLGGVNTYTGDTRILAGNLLLTTNAAAPANTGLSLQNSTVDLNAADAGLVRYRGSSLTTKATFGGLKGSRNHELVTTAGAAVTISVGNNNQNTLYSGSLFGPSGAAVTKIGTGTLILAGANTYDGPTTITSGTLQLGNGGSIGSLATGSTIVNDGSLVINRDNTVVQGVDFSSGPITGSGSFTQAGPGMTVLNVGNSYTGPTIVAAGKLVATSDQFGTGALNVGNGATLVVNAVGASQWQPSTLTLGAGAGCTLEFGNVGTVAPLSPSAVTRNGTVAVRVTGLSGAIVVGGAGYPLLANAGASAAGYTLALNPPGTTGHLAVSGNTLTYVVDTVSDIWNAAAPGGNWDIGLSANWTGNAANNTPINTYKNGDVVLFNDNVWGPQTVTVAAAVIPNSVNIDNSLTDYSIVSTAGNNISGSASLAKSGTGALTLSGPNTYSGGTILNGGTLNINGGATSNADSPIGTGPLTINAGTIDNTSGAEVSLTSNNAQNWNGDFTFNGTSGLNLGTGAVTPTGNRQITVNGSLTVGGPIGGTSSLTKAGFGPLTLSGASTYSGGTFLNSGQLNINYGGSSSANSAIGVGPLTISANALIDNTSGNDVTLQPTIAQTWAGNFTYLGTANNLNLGNGPVTLTGNRTVTVTAGTLAVGGPISGSFELVKSGPGTLVLTGVNTFTGQMNLSDGTLAVGNDQSLGTGRLNLRNATTIMSVDSTPHTITNSLNFDGTDATITFGGTGNLTFTGNNANNSSGKSFSVNNQTEFQGNISGTTRTIGGTGKMIISGTTSYGTTAINPGATLQVGNGGATGTISGSSAVIANDGTLIINRNNSVLQSSILGAGGISGYGTLIQAGTGVTTLNAPNNTFGGPVKVNNGGLLISTTYQGGSEVTVANGAHFGVTASATTGNATIGNLTMGAGGATTLDFSYNVVGNPTAPALQAGAVVVSGTSTIRIGGNFTVGTFPVLKYSSLSGTFATAVAAPRGVTATASNNAADQTIYVTVTAVTSSPILWSGTDAVLPNVWDIGTTKNWLASGSTTEYLELAPPGDSVSFDDSGSGVVLLSNTVSPSRVTINNSTVAYAFSGTGQINSSLGLSKTGAGSVSLNVPGVYSGSTVLSNGTVSIDANQTFANMAGDAPLNNIGATARVITADNSADTTYYGTVNGGLGITKIGSGSLTLSGQSTFTGNLYAKSGTVIIDTGGAIDTGGTWASIGHNGNDVATLTIKGSGSFTNSGDFNVGDVGAAVGVLNIQDNGSLKANRIYIASANAAGSTAQGTVNQTGGTVTQTETAANSFAIGGRITGATGVAVYNISGGSIWSGGGFRVGGFGTGTLNISGTATLYSGGGINIGREAGSSGTVNFNGGVVQTRDVISSQFTGVANFNGSTIIPISSRDSFIQDLAVANVRNGGIIIDTTNLNVTVAQSLAHSMIEGDNATDGGLIKLGSGRLYLSGVNSYTGNTVVSEGLLAGVGIVSSPVIVNPNGRIGAGNAAGIGALTVNSSLAIQGGATLRLNKTGGALLSDMVVVSGAASYGGVLTLTNITSDGTPLAVGDSFTLFTAGTHSGSFSSIVGPAGYGASFNNGVLTITSIGPSSPGTIASSFAGNVLSLSWPAGENWRLQSATNLVTPNWEYVTDGSVNSTDIPVDPAKPAVFFRLVYP